MRRLFLSAEIKLRGSENEVYKRSGSVLYKCLPSYFVKYCLVNPCTSQQNLPSRHTRVPNFAIRTTTLTWFYSLKESRNNLRSFSTLSEWISVSQFAELFATDVTLFRGQENWMRRELKLVREAIWLWSASPTFSVKRQLTLKCQQLQRVQQKLQIERPSVVNRKGCNTLTLLASY